jgi:uncharacterized SAM-binding protein YcdF (DUF218 family)
LFAAPAFRPDEMSFALKKFLAFWLMPLPVCLVLLVAGLGLLLVTKRVRLGRALLVIGLGLLLLSSNKAVSAWLIRPLESEFPAIPEFADGAPIPAALADCRYVVVLGGGHADVDGFSAVNELSNSARARLTEGLRLFRVLPAAQLIVSGRGADGRPSHARVLATAAISLGADPTRIIRLETPRDTEDEANELRQQIGEAPFALVSSAWHLRRATALMRHAGLRPLPCPCDYQARRAPGASLGDYGWDSDSLGRSTWAVYERIGYMWLKLRGKV